MRQAIKCLPTTRLDGAETPTFPPLFFRSLYGPALLTWRKYRLGSGGYSGALRCFAYAGRQKQDEDEVPGHHPSGTHLALSAFPVLGKVKLSETHIFVILLLLHNRILLTSSDDGNEMQIHHFELGSGGNSSMLQALCAEVRQYMRTTVMPAVQACCDV